MHASSRLARVAGLVLAVVLPVAGAAGPVQAGSFKAESLRDCVGYTEWDLTHLAPGTELPFAGVRLFRNAGQRGASRAYCLTLTWDPDYRFCCWSYGHILLPEALRGRVASLRFVAAADCMVAGEMAPRNRAWWFHPRFFNWGRDPSQTRWAERDVPIRYDGRIAYVLGYVSCWDGGF